MHTLTASFVLGYHGCDVESAEKLLNNQPFIKSENDYDWLGSGIYFWEANPDRALAWAHETAARKAAKDEVVKPTVIGAVISLGFCLDLITDNGIRAVEEAHRGFLNAMTTIGTSIPVNTGSGDRKNRKLDCAVLNYLHASRKRATLDEFDTVRVCSSKMGRYIPPERGYDQGSISCASGSFFLTAS